MRTQAEQIAALTQEAERLGLGVSVIARLVAHVVEAEERGLVRATEMDRRFIIEADYSDTWFFCGPRSYAERKDDRMIVFVPRTDDGTPDQRAVPEPWNE